MIGEKLKSRRTELALTQDEVAKNLHVSRQAISNWELGKNHPDLETIIVISDYYQISLDTLLKGDERIVKEINKKTGLKIAKNICYGLVLLGGTISLIVDLAINRQLSWSLIVILTLALVMIPSMIVTSSKTAKLLKGSSVLSCLIPVYLLLLESILISNHYVQEKWFMEVALPICLLWLGVLWLVGLIKWRFKWQWSYSLALLCLVAIPANYLTNLIGGTETVALSTLITSISNGIGAVLFVLVGKFIDNYQSAKK